MNTIRIFLAFSEELEDYRMSFGLLLRSLNDMYEKRGIQIKLYEDYDALYINRSNQDEYNNCVCMCHMFIALFNKHANIPILEEFNVALDAYRQHKHPKIYVYCKDIPKEDRSEELKSFQKVLWDEMQYYWCHFDNLESMQFHFVMQLQSVISNGFEELKVEDGMVTLNGLPIAKLDKLKFAAANEDYKKMRKELLALPEKIEKARILFNRYPDDKDLKDDWYRALNRYNKLKEDFAIHQQLLFDTAKRVAQMQGNRITDRMRRAMDALNNGEVQRAIIILDVEEDARRNLEEFRHNKEISELKRRNLFYNIEELQLKASTIMADVCFMTDVRIAQVQKIFNQADEIAQVCKYDKEKYIKLLFDYVDSLYKFSSYEKALEIAGRLVLLCEEVNGKNHANTFKSYNKIANIYMKLGDMSTAQVYLDKAKG